MSSRFGSDSGFSLIEALIATVLTAIVVGAALSLMFQSQARAADRAGDEELRQLARVVVPKVGEALRLAGFRAGDVTPVEVAGPTHVRLVADLDDGSTGEPCVKESPTHPRPERITFEVRSDGQLMRGVQCRDAKNTKWIGGTSWSVLAAGVDPEVAFFRYFDEDGAELGDGVRDLTAAELEELHSVAVEFVARREEERVLGSGDELVASERIVLRNLIILRRTAHLR